MGDVAIIISCGNNCAACILFSLIARKEVPPWQRLREMHAFRAEDGKIFAPCIRFRVQSGDFGYIARKSCQGGGIFVSRSTESCIGRESCQRSALCGSLRSSGQNKGPCRAGRGHVYADCPCSASASLDMKKAPEGAFFICYAICGVRRRQADFLQLIAARSQQKGPRDQFRGASAKSRSRATPFWRRDRLAEGRWRDHLAEDRRRDRGRTTRFCRIALR